MEIKDRGKKILWFGLVEFQTALKPGLIYRREAGVEEAARCEASPGGQTVVTTATEMVDLTITATTVTWKDKNSYLSLCSSAWSSKMKNSFVLLFSVNIIVNEYICHPSEQSLNPIYCYQRCLYSIYSLLGSDSRLMNCISSHFNATMIQWSV